MPHKKHKKSPSHAPPRKRGCLLGCCLAWLLGAGLLASLVVLAMLVVPEWNPFTEHPAVSVAQQVVTPGASVAFALQAIFALGLWRWRRWGWYGLLALQVFGIVFGLLSLAPGLLPTGNYPAVLTQFTNASRGALLGLPPFIVLWFLLKPHWKRMH